MINKYGGTKYGRKAPRKVIEAANEDAIFGEPAQLHDPKKAEQFKDAIKLQRWNKGRKPKRKYGVKGGRTGPPERPK